MGIKMGYSYIDEPDALAHYGILGMKWGRRPSDPNPNDASHHPVKSVQTSRGETTQPTNTQVESKNGTKKRYE